MSAPDPYDPLEVKQLFPFFKAHPEWIYLDTAATAQKPQCVIDAMNEFMIDFNAPVHRAAYDLSYVATQKYEQARETIARFIGSSVDEVIFTKGTTEALNLIASGLRSQVGPGDELIVCETEHHANLLPWQQLALKTGAKLVKLPVCQTGHIDLDSLKALLNPQVKVVAMAHMSNVTGAVQEIKKISELMQDHEAFLIIDGAQGVCHEKVEATYFDAYAFSSHKIYGPTGLGVCHLSPRLQEALDLYQVGGDVIESVTFERTLYKKDRARFEAGTPMVTEVIGLEAALKFLTSCDLQAAHFHERQLVIKLQQELKKIEGVHLIGSSDTALVSLYTDRVHPLDLASYASARRVALRSGHLCAQPALARFHTSHALRLSCGLYTTLTDVQYALDTLQEAFEFFRE